MPPNFFPANSKLARVCDRTWIDPVYRNQYLNRKNEMAVRPIIDYFVPTQTRYCIDNDIVPFISVQYPSRTKVLERVARETELGYELLDDLLFTCHHDNYDSTNCWHRVISIGDTGLMRKTTDEVDSIHERRVIGGVDLSGVLNIWSTLFRRTNDPVIDDKETLVVGHYRYVKSLRLVTMVTVTSLRSHKKKLCPVEFVLVNDRVNVRYVE